MPIQIGAKPESSFSDPLGLLSDCHRRIEKFLAQMIHITETARGGPLDEIQSEALAVALRYFTKAAPLHTQDEETSLFPRMRASGDQGAREALAALDALESDHREADILHAEVDRLGNLWLRQGDLLPADAGRLIKLLRALQTLYTHHIAVEDTRVFPLAGKLLESPALDQVGREMAVRRGLDPDNLPGVSHCQLRKQNGLPVSRTPASNETGIAPPELGAGGRESQKLSAV
jgi:hemerythrin-like domain-containing protein